MRFFFVTALTNIEIPDELGRGDKIDNTTFITNNFSPISSKHITPGFSKLAGLLETGFIAEAPAVIYALDEVEEGTSSQEYLIKKLYLVSSFLNTLWLVKDNAINNDLGFVLYTRHAEEILDSNFHNVKYSTANGQVKTFQVTRAEIRKARDILRKRFGPFQIIQSGSSAIVTSLGRVVRALYFTQMARSNRDIGIKISSYCTALESLFATETEELTHRLSERVCAFLEDEPMGRASLYSSIKKAYVLRSTVVHGAAAKPSKAKDLIVASEQLDNCLRRILGKLLSDSRLLPIFELPKDNFNQLFLLRVFGAPWEDLVKNGVEQQREKTGRQEGT